MDAGRGVRRRVRVAGARAVRAAVAPMTPPEERNDRDAATARSPYAMNEHAPTYPSAFGDAAPRHHAHSAARPTRRAFTAEQRAKLVPAARAMRFAAAASIACCGLGAAGTLATLVV